jgi:flagellar basal body rod protein FlgB
MEPPAWSADGNSVQLERETVRLTENALMYEAVSTGLSKRLAMLRFAAADGRTG